MLSVDGVVFGVVSVQYFPRMFYALQKPCYYPLRYVKIFQPYFQFVWNYQFPVHLLMLPKMMVCLMSFFVCFDSWFALSDDDDGGGDDEKMYLKKA